MGDLIRALGDFIVQHRAWAAPAFGLLAFGESLAIAGAIIPATPILFLVGTLLGKGELDPVPVLACAMAGALLGYWASWAAGRRWGPAVFRTGLLRPHRRSVARTRLFFRRWGGPALIVGRYALGPLQSLLPLVAGAANMGAVRFHGWSTASGIIWVVVCLTPGFLAGRGLLALGLGDAAQTMLIGGLTAISASLVLAVSAIAVWQAIRRRQQPRPAG